MSRNSRRAKLLNRIRLLDADYTAPLAERSTLTNLAERARQFRQRYLRQIYETGVVPRSDVKALSVCEMVPIPEELLNDCPAPAIEFESEPIPEEILHPPRKPGRPKRAEIHEQASNLRSSLRHTRRLLASGKPRQRDQRRPPDVVRALKAREERAILSAELETERILFCLTIDLGRKSWPTAFTPPPRARFPRKMIRTGPPNVRAIICSALAAGDVDYAASLLGISRATLYRLLRGRLPELRKRGEEIAAAIYARPDLDLAGMSKGKPPTFNNRMAEGGESGWNQQTRVEQTRIRPARGRRG